MANVGVQVLAQEIPPATSTIYNTANAFIPVLSDWGPIGQAIPVTSLANGASQLGTPSGSGNPYSSRTSTCATAFDALDTLFHEDGVASPTVYATRVAHGSPTSATIVLAPSTAVTFTAQYPGYGGNGIYVACQNNTSSVVITLQDVNANTLAVSPSLTSLAAIVTWAATTGYVTAATSGSTLPSTASATAMSGGADNRGSLVIGDVTTALNCLGAGLGPGQVFAPSWTNTTLSGIWSALGSHGQTYNRVAICDMDDNVTAATLVSDIASFGATAAASYCGFWGGNRNIPGVTPGTTRSIAPSPAIAALCARVDATGNPNLAAAGINWPLAYATTPTSLVSGAPLDTYSLTDLNTLNGSGINTFHNGFGGGPMNYGFTSSDLSTSDLVYWQFNHSRMRMAITAQAQVIGQPYVFSQIDGAGADAAAFNGALSAMLYRYQQVGALYVAPGQQYAFTVDTGSDVNTPATIAAGQLNAAITTSFSPYAQNVTITVNVVPTTQAV